MSTDVISLIVSISIALLVSASCSVAESVLLSLSPSQLADLVAKRPTIGKYWLGFKKDLNLPISSILVLNTTAHTIGAAVAGAAFDNIFGSRHMWLFSLAFTYAMLQFTEILPKTLAVKYNRALAVLIARPLHVGTMVLKPVVRLLQKVNHLFEPKDLPAPKKTNDVDELRHLVSMARGNNLLNPKQEEIILATVALSRQTARDVMISLPEVVMLSTDSTLRQVIDLLRFDAHTRIPVCRGKNRDDIAGYINVKEVLPPVIALGEDQTLAEIPGLIHDVPTADLDTPALSLLSTIIAHPCHMAVITDQVEENQKTDSALPRRCCGIATLEDVIEQLIGEISDEFDSDRLPRTIKVLGDNSIVVNGGFPMHDLPRIVARELFSIPDDQPIDTLSVGDDFKSVAQWLRDRLGRDPVVGDICPGKSGVELLVKRVHRGKAFDVQIRVNPDSGAAENPTSFF